MVQRMMPPPRVVPGTPTNADPITQLFPGSCFDVFGNWSCSRDTQGERIQNAFTGARSPAVQFDLIFLDPPFGIGYDYHGEHCDKVKPEEYARFIDLTCHYAAMHLAPQGSLFVAISDEYAA